MWNRVLQVCEFQAAMLDWPVLLKHVFCPVPASCISYSSGLLLACLFFLCLPPVCFLLRVMLKRVFCPVPAFSMSAAVCLVVACLWSCAFLLHVSSSRVTNPACRCTVLYAMTRRHLSVYVQHSCKDAMRASEHMQSKRPEMPAMHVCMQQSPVTSFHVRMHSSRVL